MSAFRALWYALIAGYLPTYFDDAGTRDGRPWRRFQTLKFWKWLLKPWNPKVILEKPLDSTKKYIFCCFPHGPYSANHLLLMTDACGMLSEHYTGERRDLVASVLLTIPLFKELMLWLGNVDASNKTAAYNLSKGRSIFIYVGGEKEQLMSENGRHKIYLNSRKGFVKLALKHNAELVPMYAYGECEGYTISQFLLGFRFWLQKNFQLGIPIAWGQFGVFLPVVPYYRESIQVEIGKPVSPAAFMASNSISNNNNSDSGIARDGQKVVQTQQADLTLGGKGKGERRQNGGNDESPISQEQIDELHAEFVREMQRLFERTKRAHGVPETSKLEIF